MWRRTLALTATLLIAGCASPTQDDPPTAPGADPVEPPTWALGDWWRFADSMGNTFSLVVTEDAGGDWQVLPDSLATAYHHFQDPVSFMGAVRKSDLAGSQGADRVRYFDWPLRDNHTWSTPWDGVTRTITAAQGEGGRWNFEAVEDGALAVAYTYDPDARWFGEMDFLNTTDGSVLFSITLDGRGEDFTGEVYRYTDEQAAASLETSLPGPAQGTFPVTDAFNQVHIQATYECESPGGVMMLGVTEPQPDGSAAPAPPLPFVAEPDHGFMATCFGGSGSGSVEVLAAAVPGTWRYDALVGSPGEITLRVTLRAYETITLPAGTTPEPNGP